MSYARYPARDGGEDGGIEAVLEFLHRRDRGGLERLGRRAVDELAAEVLILQDLPEPPTPQSLTEELQSGFGLPPVSGIQAHLPRQEPHGQSMGEHPDWSTGHRPPQVQSGPCSGCTTPMKATSLISFHDVRLDRPGDGGLETYAAG